MLRWVLDLVLYRASLICCSSSASAPEEEEEEESVAEKMPENMDGRYVVAWGEEVDMERRKMTGEAIRWRSMQTILGIHTLRPLSPLEKRGLHSVRD